MRPTNDKVRDFLQLRRDNANTAEVAGDKASKGRFGRQDNDVNTSRVARNEIGQLNLRDQINDSKNAGDRAWAQRFGNSNSATGERLRPDNAAKPLDGNSSRRFGNATVQGEGRSGSDRRLDRGLVDRTYQDWRKNASSGEHGPGADHRDWSGRWKDGERFVAAHDIREHWNDRGHHKDLPFCEDWWRGHNRHDGHWNHWDHFADHHHRPFFWWDSCSAPRLTTWIGFDFAAPCYWDYGPGEYIYCNDGVMYVNGTWFEPAPTYYQRTVLLVQQAPHWTALKAAAIEWLPLGVFAVARDGVADNNVLVQLAVTRDGVIGGTIFNQLTGATFPIEGMVDKQTQRAVWAYFDDTGAQIVMESSIFNLTQPEATGLVHYGPDNIQVIELVRLDEPNIGP